MKNDYINQVKVIILCLIIAFIFIFGVSKAQAQQQPVFIECTAGDYPDEISWEIMDCDGDIITAGGAPYLLIILYLWKIVMVMVGMVLT